MDSTRVEAGRRPQRPDVRTEPVEARTPIASVGPTVPAPAKTPRMQPATMVQHDELEKSVATFVVAIARDERELLLEGLAPSRRVLATVEAEELAALDSATRQARIARQFGLRKDADARLRELMAETGPTLRREIFRRLPPYLRSLFPAMGPVRTHAASRELTAHADRLIKEATR